MGIRHSTCSLALPTRSSRRHGAQRTSTSCRRALPRHLPTHGAPSRHSCQSSGDVVGHGGRARDPSDHRRVCKAYSAGSSPSPRTLLWKGSSWSECTGLGRGLARTVQWHLPRRLQQSPAPELSHGKPFRGAPPHSPHPRQASAGERVQSRDTGEKGKPAHVEPKRVLAREGPLQRGRAVPRAVLRRPGYSESLLSELDPLELLLPDSEELLLLSREGPPEAAEAAFSFLAGFLLLSCPLTSCSRFSSSFFFS